MTTTHPPIARAWEPGAYEPLHVDEAALTRAWEPSAYGGFWSEEQRPKPYRMAGAVAVVEIIGALDTRAGWWWDGYDAVLTRTRAALEDPAVRAVVLEIDSPGGMAAGNLDTAQAMRAAADAAGKPLVAHAGTMACSAAYALACAADKVLLTADGAVGSIGTIATVYDRTKANADRGLDVRVVRSGALKADPHPDAPLTDAAVARVRARINELAGMFAGWVAERRPATGDPLTLQGATVYGADAVTRGLADAVGTLADAISTAADLAADSDNTRKKTMDLTKAKSLLEAARASAGAATDEELPATIAALKATAGQVPDLARQRDEARAALAARDAADAAAARETVLARHRASGALTPAMEADATFMSDLAPLGADALDRVLSKLPPLPTTATKATPPGASPTTPGASRTRALTDAEKSLCRQAGVTEDEYRAALAQQETTR